MSTDKCRMAALELRMLMSFAHKYARMSMEQRLAEMGVDVSGFQLGIMRVIRNEGEHTISELAKFFMLDPSTFVPVIDSLERKNMVVRRRDPKDRRRVLIALTELGESIEQKFDSIPDNDPVYQAFHLMGEKKTDTLMTLMRELLMNMPEGDKLLGSIEARMRLADFVPAPSDKC
jgi:DNA-binding MarR family transcriptional regulator